MYSRVPVICGVNLVTETGKQSLEITWRKAWQETGIDQRGRYPKGLEFVNEQGWEDLTAVFLGTDFVVNLGPWLKEPQYTRSQFKEGLAGHEMERGERKINVFSLRFRISCSTAKSDKMQAEMWNLENRPRSLIIYGDIELWRRISSRERAMAARGVGSLRIFWKSEWAEEDRCLQTWKK